MGQLLEPHLTSPRQSAGDVHGPSFSEHGLHLQNPISPLLKLAQSTENLTSLNMKALAQPITI